MKSLQEIKEEYARTEGYKDWGSLAEAAGYCVEDQMNEVCRLYAIAAIDQCAEDVDLVYEGGWCAHEIDKQLIWNVEQKLV